MDKFPKRFTVETKLNRLIDIKFDQGEPKQWPESHDESVQLLASRALHLCSVADRLWLYRPLPGQSPRTIETIGFGGPRVMAMETDNRSDCSIQTDFFAIGDQMYMRKSYYDPVDSTMVPAEPLNTTDTEDVFDWVETAIPEPKYR